MGVWIETMILMIAISSLLRHTLYGCVDWNSELHGEQITKERHTLYGCVDWNTALPMPSAIITRHTLYGCVDWNLGQER